MRAALAALTLLGACATPAPPAPQTPDEATAVDSCGAARFIALIGAPADRIDPATLPLRTRILAPDMMVTQDFAPGRLNIIVGSDGRVGSLRCF